MKTIALYLGERVPPVVFGPAIVLLTGLSAWSRSSIDLAGTLLTVAVMAALVFQFRVWDDLEDRSADARIHPDRVLVRRAPGPVRALGGVFGATALILAAIVEAWDALAVIVALDVAFWLAYRRFRVRLPARVWQYHVLPLKYAGFVLAAALVGGPPPVLEQLSWAAAVAYLGATAYEWLHTRRPATAGVSQ